MVLPFIATPATPADMPTVETTVTAPATAARGADEHTVRSGESAYDIAQRYRVEPSALLEHNHISAGEHLHPGQQLRIPPRPSELTEERSERPSRSGSTRSYMVRTGDTLSGIAARHHMSIERLRTLNDLDEQSFLRAGEKVRVTGTVPRQDKRTPRRPAATTTHTVRRGENLTGIASRYRMSPTRLAKLNSLAPGDLLTPGQRLRVADSERSSRDASRGSSDGVRARGAEFDHNTFEGRTYPEEVVEAAAETRRTLAGRDVPTRQEVHDKVVRTAKRHGVDPSLALAVSYKESGWDHRQVSVANAVGTMQMIPSSGEWASAAAGRDLDLLDTDDNITAGVLLLKSLTEQAPNTAEAVAGYYQGLASVRENGMYEDTKQYVSDVKTLQQRM